MRSTPRYHMISNATVDDRDLSHSVRLISQLTLAGIVITLVTSLGLWLVGAPVIIILLLVPLALVGIVILITTRSLSRRITKNNQRIYYLEANNQALEQHLSELDHSRAKRVDELDHRVYLLQTIIDIIKAWDSPDFRSIGDIDQILSESTTIISERLNLSVVNIFMNGSYFEHDNEELADRLCLRAASTENGRRLVQTGYSISMYQENAISSAARTLVPIFPGNYQQNSNLETVENEPIDGEIAFPLIQNARLIGILDLQGSSVCPLFSQDQEILQILAEQLSNLIDNARMVETNSANAQTIDKEDTRPIRKTEIDLSHNQTERGFCANSSGDLTAVNDNWDPIMVEAWRRGEVVFGEPVELSFTLVVPVKIRNQVAGVVRLRKPPEAGKWRPEEVALVERLGDRLSAALESARLFGETRRAAEREHLTSEITTKMRATNDPQMVLQIAARELRRALHADKAQLRVQTEAVHLSKIDQACSPDQAGD